MVKVYKNLILNQRFKILNSLNLVSFKTRKGFKW